MRPCWAISGIVGAAIALAGLVAGCGGVAPVEGAQEQQPAQTQPEDGLKPVPPTPIAIKKAELLEPTWDPAWDMMIEKALPGDLVSRKRAPQVGSLCPRYSHLRRSERRAFWAYFFQALAGAEAGLTPTADVHHTDPEVDVVDSVTHRAVHQEGLLQLTYMDSQRYGCEFDWEKDKALPEHDPAKTILQPRNNLLCGVRILENQLGTRREPLLTNQSYWSTLRPDNASYAVFKKQMANVPEYCKAATQRGEQNRPPMIETKNQTPKTNQGTVPAANQSAANAKAGPANADQTGPANPQASTEQAKAVQ